ncbi:dynein regulatory complex subunit 3 isoform X2 [Gambusia affinis]|uniref:dynein regulatory complex subunit 3 isoform X2 n=1 Tax=Gambusia affinis TaxID=33528 RepID=UPI001CDD1E29|nr:dynein regulatory complex subunit 3 isoform X2 [Gambusia affinis]
MDTESSSSDDEYTLQEMLLEQHTSKEKYALHNYNLGCLDHREHIRLQLEFKNMVKMDFLHDFTSLIRLDLNNNIIQRIWGLDRLINLTWLNLSFNKIENIEGLDSLRKLELLNLAFNKISVIKNMDTLENLTHFFISKNQITQKECVHYLMRFKNLFKLSIGGNPFTEKDDHSLYVAAFIPNVTLLDNILITPKMREEAAVQYKFELKKFLESQNAQEKIDEDTVVDSAAPVMSADEAEATRPDSLPGAPPAQTSQSKIVQLCSQIFPIDSDEYKQLETELNSFFVGQSETEAHYQQRSLEMLASFDEQHSVRIKDIKNIQDPELHRLKIIDLRNLTSNLFKNLMGMEFEFVKNLDDNIILLDNFISDMAMIRLIKMSPRRPSMTQKIRWIHKLMTRKKLSSKKFRKRRKRGTVCASQTSTDFMTF